MANFRSGFLQRGYPLGKLSLYIDLNTDTQAVDMTGYTELRINSVVGNNVSCVRSGAGPYTITVTSPNHGLSTDDDIEVTFAGSWTTDANAIPAGNIADITVVDANTFTYEVPTDPGPSGVINWVPLESARTLTFLPGTLEGQTFTVVLMNGPNNQPTTPNAAMIFIDNTVPMSIQSQFRVTSEYSNIVFTWVRERWVEQSRTVMPV